MNADNIGSSRLISQQISDSKIKTPNELVEWMCAMQSQDFNMAKWAIGIRIPGSSDALIDESFNRGKILRTHVLRPTWHFIAAEDIHWMLELTAPYIKAAMKSRRNDLGLTDDLINKSNTAIEKSLSAGEHLTREEIIGALKKAGIIMNDPQAYYHLILYAELDALICSGELKGKEHTYALLAMRSPKKNILYREQALAELCKRYFNSHGPATLQDFSWWSSLPLRDARKAVELLRPDLLAQKIGEMEYWYSALFPKTSPFNNSMYLLPAYDEFIISYKNRSSSLPENNMSKAISSNGIFRPVIVFHGQVVGTWKRTSKKNKTILEPAFFKSPDKVQRNLFEDAVAFYSNFLHQTIEIIWS